MVRSKSLAAASGRKQRIECIVKNLSDRIMTKTPSLFNGPTESPSVLFEQRMESSMCSTTWTSDLTDSVYHLPAGLEFCGVVCAKTLSQGRKFGPFTGKITPKTVQPSFDYSFVCQVPDVDGNFYNLNLLGREMDSYRWLKSLQRFSSYDDYNAVMYNTPSGVILETVAEVGEGIELCIAYDQSCDVAEVSQASNGTEQMENIDQFNPLSVGLGVANEAELFISSGTPVSPYSNTIALETDDAAEIIKDSKLTYNVMTADVAKDNSGPLKSEDKNNTFSTAETRKLDTETSHGPKERSSKLKVKSGRDAFKAEVVERTDSKKVPGESAISVNLDPIYGKNVSVGVSKSGPEMARAASGKRKRKTAATHKNATNKQKKTSNTGPTKTNIRKKPAEWILSVDYQSESESEHDISRNVGVHGLISLLGKGCSLSVDDNDNDRMNASFAAEELILQSSRKHLRPVPGNQAVWSRPGASKTNFLPKQQGQDNQQSILMEVLQICRSTLSCVQAMKSQMEVRSEQATCCDETLPTVRKSLVLSREQTTNIPEELTLFSLEARTKALSVGHFATLLAQHIFPPEERKNRNCLGKKGKLALDPAKLSQIKNLVYKCYDVIVKDQERVWKECILRIDEMLRRKPKAVKDSV